MLGPTEITLLGHRNNSQDPLLNKVKSVQRFFLLQLPNADQITFWLCQVSTHISLSHAEELGNPSRTAKLNDLLRVPPSFIHLLERNFITSSMPRTWTLAMIYTNLLNASCHLGILLQNLPTSRTSLFCIQS